MNRNIWINTTYFVKMGKMPLETAIIFFFY